MRRMPHVRRVFYAGQVITCVLTLLGIAQSVKLDEPATIEDQATSLITDALQTQIIDLNDVVVLEDGIPYQGSISDSDGKWRGGCGTGQFPGIWHTYVSTSNGLAKLRLISESDNILIVLDAGNGNIVACNGESIPDGDDRYISETRIAVNEYEDYCIRVECHGAYTITAQNIACPVPMEPRFPNPVDDATDVHFSHTVLSWNHPPESSEDSKRNLDGHDLMVDSMELQAIYGDDSRIDEYQVVDSNILYLADSVVALVDSGDIVSNSDGTITLPWEPLADYRPNQIFDIPICPNEPFIRQPTAAFCTGFLVGPDVIATCGHCISSEELSYVTVVFGYVMDDAYTPVLTFDESQIYYCQEIIAREGGMSDWTLVRLDREVIDHEPLPVRYNGYMDKDQRLLIIGHPLGLPRKHADGALRRSDDGFPYFWANVDSFAGNSGSPVINAYTFVVEGINRSGPPSWDLSGDCYRARSYPDDRGHSELGWQKIVRSTEFADFMPRYDVYLGIEANALRLVSSDITSPGYTCGVLLENTVYYWQVVSKNGCSQTHGPIWSFTTKEQN